MGFEKVLLLSLEIILTYAALEEKGCMAALHDDA
jgi:hypothetical protein